MYNNKRRKSKRRYSNNSNEEVIFLNCYSADRLNAEMKYYGKLGFKLRGKVFTKHYYINDRGPGFSSTSYCEGLSATMVRKATGEKLVTYDEMLRMKSEKAEADRLKKEKEDWESLSFAGKAAAVAIGGSWCIIKSVFERTYKI